MDHNDLKNIEYIKDYLTENSVVVDVGAHTGGYTDFFLSKLNEFGKIYCVELNPQNFKTLTNKYSNYSNVFLYNKAVSDVDGQINYYEGTDSYTYNIIGHDMNLNKNNIIGLIDSIRLDTLLRDEKEIDLVKIDVEGAEYSVLRGLGKVVDNIKNILLECHLDKDWREIYELLKINFICYDILRKTQVSDDSPRPYQCFCKKK